MADTKETIEQIKKHHFWILSVVVLLTALTCWYMGTSAIAEEEQAKRSELEGTFSSVQQQAGREYHPNPSYVEGVGEFVKRQERQVYDAWVVMHRAQQEGFTWPAAITDPEVRTPLVDGSYLQLSRATSRSLLERIGSEYREKFLTQTQLLKNDLNLLEYEVVLPEEGEEDETYGLGYGEETYEEETYDDYSQEGEVRIDRPTKGIVAFPNFSQLLARYPWLDRPTPPVPEEIRYAQEDVWVYRTLFKIIADANGDIAEADQAQVRQIEVLEIGQNTASPAPMIVAELRAKVGTSTSLSGEVEGDYDDGEFTEGETTGTPVNTLVDNRYVDNAGQPVKADVKPVPEYNMLPFRMVLTVRQTGIEPVLVACMNSAVPVKVRSFQVFPIRQMPPAGGTFGSGASSSTYGGEESFDSRFGGGFGEGMDGGAAAGRIENLPSIQPERGEDATLEIRGVVHLFREPTLEIYPLLKAEQEALAAESEDEFADETAAAPVEEEVVEDDVTEETATGEEEVTEEETVEELEPIEAPDVVRPPEEQPAGPPIQ